MENFGTCHTFYKEFAALMLFLVTDAESALAHIKKYKERRRTAYNKEFAGAHAILSHPTLTLPSRGWGWEEAM